MKFLINYLLKRLLRNDFVSEPDIIKRTTTYLKMNEPQILELLKSIYTNAYASYLVANKEEEIWMQKGRILQLLDLLNSIENAEETLLHINEAKQRSERREEILSSIKKHLISPNQKLKK